MKPPSSEEPDVASSDLSEKDSVLLDLRARIMRARFLAIGARAAASRPKKLPFVHQNDGWSLKKEQGKTTSVERWLAIHL